jgi:hypothetical protein
MENTNTPTLQHSNTPKKFTKPWQFVNTAISVIFDILVTLGISLWTSC